VKFRTIALVAVLLGIAVTVAQALITWDGVGAVEYVVGVVLVIALVGLALQVSRRGLQRS
jgi:hypothetical protein